MDTFDLDTIDNRDNSTTVITTKEGHTIEITRSDCYALLMNMVDNHSDDLDECWKELNVMIRELKDNFEYCIADYKV